MRPRYLGFDEGKLLAAAKELTAIGLRPPEVYAAMNLAGAKWRAVQVKEGRSQEAHVERDSLVFQKASKYILQTTMTTTIQLGKLGHAVEGERFMFIAISATFNMLLTRGPRSIREWLEEGDTEARKFILPFAVGSFILLESDGIDFFFDRMVRFRYGFPFDAGKDVTAPVLGVIGSLGKAGYGILKPITDSID